MNQSLLALLQLSDTALPIGGYSHSFGLETYVQKHLVHDVITATEFVQQMLSQNLRYNDASFVSLAYDAAAANDYTALIALDNLCSASKTPTESRNASIKMGIRMLKIFGPLTNHKFANIYKQAIDDHLCSGHHCIAFGVFGVALKIEKPELLNAFYYNAAAGYVTNCVKLIPLGQQSGQEILFESHRLIEKLVAETMIPDASLIGLCNPGFDLRSMQHEELYSRLYMS